MENVTLAPRASNNYPGKLQETEMLLNVETVLQGENEVAEC
jgi:hypothetical protein